MATPVTTSASRRSTSRSMLTEYVVCPADTGRVLARKPMRRTVSDLASAGRVIVKCPLSLATVPTFVPVTMTCADAIGALSVASTTRPVTFVCDCARADQLPSNTAAPSTVATRVAVKRTHIGRSITHLPCQGPRTTTQLRVAHQPQWTPPSGRCLGRHRYGIPRCRWRPRKKSWGVGPHLIAAGRDVNIAGHAKESAIGHFLWATAVRATTLSG